MSPHEPEKPSAEAQAAKWMAARDRGFTPAEQDEYLQWLSDDPIHGAEIARLSRAWNRLDSLHRWNPTHSIRPNADLLLPRHRRTRWRRTAVVAAAAAVAITAGTFWMQSTETDEDPRNVIMHPAPRRLALEDGSLVELNTDARIVVNYSPGTRAGRLTQGGAHFIVAKNPDRPFVVSAGDYAVRAVGTAFNVTLGESDVAVLVTEGEVALRDDQPTSPTPPALPHLRAGQQATLSGAHDGTFDLAELSPAEIEALLAWQSLRLEFNGTPLREVIDEFNRYNRRQLVLEDDRTGDMVVGGTFRADNVEAFVRLLDVGFGVEARTDGDTVVLHRR